MKERKSKLGHYRPVKPKGSNAVVNRSGASDRRASIRHRSYLPRTTRTNCQLCADRQLEVVFTLNKNCTGSACSPNDSADRCAFSTAGNGADDGADSRSNARALDRLRGLVAALRASFVVNLDCVAIEQSHIPENSGELIDLTVP